MRKMKRICSVLLVCSLFCVGAAAQQVVKTPVSVSRTGSDEVGSLLVNAIHQELSKSTNYDLMRDEPVLDSAKLRLKVSDAQEKKGLEFFIELATADVATDEQKHGGASAVSIVIESMGLPNSWPVPLMWYHKIVITNREAINTIAKQFVIDMEAHWCNTSKNSVGGCPKELWN
jgi:hypothetical protein